MVLFASSMRTTNNGQPDAALIHVHKVLQKWGAIATGGADNTLRAWDLQSGSPISDPMIGHAGPVTCIAFSPDGTVIVSGGKDRTLRLWDPRSGQVIGHPIQYHTEGVVCRILARSWNKDRLWQR
jgi:WD40 repeat protein